MPWKTQKSETFASGMDNKASVVASARKSNKLDKQSSMSKMSKKSKFSVISGMTNKSSVMRETSALRKFAQNDGKLDADEFERDRDVNGSAAARPDGAAGDGLQYKDMKDIENKDMISINIAVFLVSNYLSHR